MMNSNFLEQAKRLSLRPYIVITTKSETTDGNLIYNARTSEIEGCIGQGDTPEQARLDLRDALVDYIESLLEDGLEVPEPARAIGTEGTGIATIVTKSNRSENNDLQETQAQSPNSYVLMVHA